MNEILACFMTAHNEKALLQRAHLEKCFNKVHVHKYIIRVLTDSNVRCYDRKIHYL